MKVIIDRFEGEYAVVELEDKTMVNMPKILIPDCDEGDIIVIEIEKEGTAKRKKDVKKLMDDLLK